MERAQLRELLERHGLALSRERGQNFLLGSNRSDELAELAGVEPGDFVLEIGTGLGALTRALAARARRVLTLEVDAGLVRALKAEQLLPENVELLHADALSLDFAALLGKEAAPRRLVANLPYSVSAPLLRAILDVASALADFSVMVQREVAQRLLAKPGGRDYGSLSVLFSLIARAERSRELAPHCFYPAPEVHSSFLRCTPRSDSPLAPGELPALERVVRAAFGTRRKTLSNALAIGLAPGIQSDAIAAALRRTGIDPRVRAETLAAEVFLDLSRALAPVAS